MFFSNHKIKSRYLWPVLFSALMMFSLGLSSFNAPTASAACPVQGCDPSDPNPHPKPQPVTRDAYFGVIDQTQQQFRVIYVTMNYPSVNTQGQNVNYSRTAYATGELNPTGANYFLSYSGTAAFKGVRIDTTRTTTFLAYGQYSNGAYGFKTTYIQGTTPPGDFHICHKWFIWYDNSTMQAYGFEPNYMCS
jgi:hypothetical protein